jgi:DNA polymerase III epsilon subunit-like protein
MKQRYEYTKYTPEVVNELLLIISGLSRAHAVKTVCQRLNLSPRQGRAVYAQYLEGKTVSGPLPQKTFKRLFCDIETSPNIVLSWRVGHKINLDYDNILAERAIICICYKWEGEEEVYALHWDSEQDDKKMLEQFVETLNEADELVGHNLNKFDLPWVKTRCIYHGLPTFPKYKVVDTLQWARRNFYFNSNRLDYIAKFLGLEGKIETHFGLWKDIVLDKCPDSMDLMIKYCKKDVVLLEKVWQRLQEVVGHKTHVGVFEGLDKWTCPRTGSTNIALNKVIVTASGIKQYQMQNLDDKTYYVISEKAYNTYLKDNFEDKEVQ